MYLKILFVKHKRIKQKKIQTRLFAINLVVSLDVDCLRVNYFKHFLTVTKFQLISLWTNFYNYVHSSSFLFIYFCTFVYFIFCIVCMLYFHCVNTVVIVSSNNQQLIFLKHIVVDWIGKKMFQSVSFHETIFL